MAVVLIYDRIQTNLCPTRVTYVSVICDGIQNLPLYIHANKRAFSTLVTFSVYARRL